MSRYQGILTTPWESTPPWDWPTRGYRPRSQRRRPAYPSGRRSLSRLSRTCVESAKVFGFRLFPCLLGLPFNRMPSFAAEYHSNPQNTTGTGGVVPEGPFRGEGGEMRHPARSGASWMESHQSAGNPLGEADQVCHSRLGFVPLLLVYCGPVLRVCRSGGDAAMPESCGYCANGCSDV